MNTWFVVLDMVASGIVFHSWKQPDLTPWSVNKGLVVTKERLKGILRHMLLDSFMLSIETMD